MKRRQRRPVLDISNEQSESSRGRWQNKYQQIAVDHPEQNGAQNNPLASLLGQYNSDSETEDGKQDSNKLNDKVNDFLKEIQMIAPETTKSNDLIKPAENLRTSSQPSETSNCAWQECFDETTGYPYYWHIETNEVTWEMPSEMKIREKSGQHNLSQIQTHHPHAQVQQWANFLPNTYPELQTNIPEGMIPKEVVARNRNRQVGLAKGRMDLEIDTQTPKKSGPRDDDSDDEKIEMITSFGNDESESETSESDSPAKKDPPVAQKPQKSGSSLPEKSPASDEEESLSIGPLLPPGIIPMIHGPENVSLDERNEFESRKTVSRSQTRRQGKNQAEDSPLGTQESGKSEEIDEEDILKRLKNQAKLLQSLGGEVPESVETLIKNNAEDEIDIISQIEKEMPVDHAARIGPEEKEGGREFADKTAKEADKKRKQGKELRISLVAGYSDESDPEEETSPKKISPQPLFPISEYAIEDNLNSVKCSGDSNASKEAFALDVKLNDTEEEAEGAKVLDDDSIGNENTSQFDKSDKLDSNGVDGGETDESRAGRPEIETSRQNLFLENLEIPNKAFQRKKRIAFDVVPNKIVRSTPEAGIPNSGKPEALLSSFCDETEKRHGFGFHKDPQADSIESYAESCGESVDKQRGTGSERDSSQIKKPISFVKGETTEDESRPKKGDFEKPHGESSKQLKELTEVVMEKIKFLSEGTQNLSAIQIMVIQLQTLVAAWEAGDLRESYLYEWLKGTGHELGRLEEAAAPPGWDCHWDRSHKRYYYRNSLTGEAQWTYPEADVVGGTEEMDLCTTPPPPDDEELQIIEEEARNGTAEKPKEDKAPLTITGDNQIVQITKDEYKSLEAPPPPQISSPSPPPPPRIFAEDLKKGKKRRGSLNERSLDSKKEKLEFGTSSSSSEAKESVDPPLPPSPPKNSQPPLPPNPPHAQIIPNPPSSEPLPPGVDPKDMPYPLPAVTTMEPSVVFAGSAQQTNPIYAATIGDRGTITLPIIDHRSAIIQGQLMHYPTYQHLHNQAMIAAAGSLGAQEAVQFMMTDYAQVYANTQVIAKPPVKSQNDHHSLGSALDSFYSDIASIEKTNAEQDSSSMQEFEPSLNPAEANTPPPTINTLPLSVAPTNSLNDTDEKSNAAVLDPAAGKEKKRKKAKIGIGKKQKEMSTMVAKWQKAQQDFDDSE